MVWQARSVPVGTSYKYRVKLCIRTDEQRGWMDEWKHTDPISVDCCSSCNRVSLCYRFVFRATVIRCKSKIDTFDLAIGPEMHRNWL
jgi:hypothetical protein